MHRATGNTSSLRGFTAGGARGVVDKIDDSKLMQAHSGTMFGNESRSDIESPQNYGFTSHNMPADKDELGNITAGAETFYSFMHGNRSFPVPGPIDDRRHRLKGLDPGDTAMHRTKDDDQQFHMSADGGFWSGSAQKLLRMALVAAGSAKPQQQQGGQQGGGGGGVQATQQDAGGGGGGSSGGSGSGGQQQQNKPTGQQSVKQANQDSKQYFEMNGTKHMLSNTEVHMQNNGTTYHHVVGQNDYCGGQKGVDKFAMIVTVKGPTKNVPGKIG